MIILPLHRTLDRIRNIPAQKLERERREVLDAVVDLHKRLMECSKHTAPPTTVDTCEPRVRLLQRTDSASKQSKAKDSHPIRDAIRAFCRGATIRQILDTHDVEATRKLKESLLDLESSTELERLRTVSEKVEKDLGQVNACISKAQTVGDNGYERTSITLTIWLKTEKVRGEILQQLREQIIPNDFTMDERGNLTISISSPGSNLNNQGTWYINFSGDYMGDSRGHKYANLKNPVEVTKQICRMIIDLLPSIE